MVRVLPWLSAFAFTTSLASCSTADYQKQVSDLSTALTNVQSSFDTLSQNEQQAFVASQTALAIQPGYQIAVLNCGLATTASKKAVVSCVPTIYNNKTKRNRSLVYQSAAPNALKLAASVAAYGTSLVTLATAQDVSDLNAAAAKSEAAIDKLATDAKIPAAQELGPIGGIVTWGFGLYLNELRLDQLRKIVNEADPVVAHASSLLSQDATLLKNNIIIQKNALLQEEQELIFDMRSTASSDKSTILTATNAFVSDATALQSLADTDVTQPFLAMRKAHAALLASLNDPQISVEAVFTQIDSFLQQAATLKAGLEKTTSAK